MANQEQLEILRQGVDVWNKWREENPDVKISFSKLILGKLTLVALISILSQDIEYDQHPHDNLFCVSLFRS